MQIFSTSRLDTKKPLLQTQKNLTKRVNLREVDLLLVYLRERKGKLMARPVVVRIVMMVLVSFNQNQVGKIRLC